MSEKGLLLGVLSLQAGGWFCVWEKIFIGEVMLVGHKSVSIGRNKLVRVVV